MHETNLESATEVEFGPTRLTFQPDPGDPRSTSVLLAQDPSRASRVGRGEDDGAGTKESHLLPLILLFSCLRTNCLIRHLRLFWDSWYWVFNATSWSFSGDVTTEIHFPGYVRCIVVPVLRTKSSDEFVTISFRNSSVFFFFFHWSFRHPANPCDFKTFNTGLKFKLNKSGGQKITWARLQSVSWDYIIVL